MTKEVYLKLRNGEKEAELKINAIDEEHQLAVVDGLFKFFDINVDFAELAEIYRRSGKAYQEFFKTMDANVDYVKEEIKEPEPEKKSIDVEDYAKSLIVQNDHYVTGIKMDSTGTPTYRCHYKCNHKTCNYEANVYIKLGSKFTNCYKCGKKLKVKNATSFGEVETGKNPEMYRDSFGNFYVAGNHEVEVTTLENFEDEKE